MAFKLSRLLNKGLLSTLNTFWMSQVLSSICKTMHFLLLTLKGLWERERRRVFPTTHPLCCPFSLQDWGDSGVGSIWDALTRVKANWEEEEVKTHFKLFGSNAIIGSQVQPEVLCPRRGNLWIFSKQRKRSHLTDTLSMHDPQSPRYLGLRGVCATEIMACKFCAFRQSEP